MARLLNPLKRSGSRAGVLTPALDPAILTGLMDTSPTQTIIIID